MTIGLILLGITAILIFFGLTERFFRQSGVKNWLAFLIVLALVIGVIVPDINIRNFSMNIGGFIVPLVAMILFIAMMRREEILKTIIATIAVASVAVATRMLISPINAGLVLASSLIVGFVGGAAAFLAGQTRLATLASAFGGIILGDVIVNVLSVYVLKDSAVFFLGSYGVFDSVILAAVFGAVLCQAVLAIKRFNSHRHIARTALSAEAGKDVKTEVGKDTGTEASKDENIPHATKENNDENFFDDFV